jgi:hypothetical protein
MAVNAADGFRRFTVSVPVVLPGGIVPEQVTPGGKLVDVFEGQVRVMAPLNPPAGVTVMVEVVEDMVPAAPAEVVTVELVAASEKVPPEFTVKSTPLLATPPTVTMTLPVVAPAGTGTTILVALQFAALDTVAAVPLNVTVLVPWVAPKFVPVIVTDVPTGPEVGFRLVIVGAGAAVMVKVGGAGLRSGPPPGCGLNVSTLTLWAVARLAAGTWTVRVVEFVMVTVLAGNGIVLNKTSVLFVPVRKLAPFTVKVSPLDPAVAVVGEIEVIPGTGFRAV